MTSTTRTRICDLFGIDAPHLRMDGETPESLLGWTLAGDAVCEVVYWLIEELVDATDRVHALMAADAAGSDPEE